MPGQEVTAMVRFRGEQEFVDRGRLTTNAQGSFTWRIRAGKTVHLYVTGDGIASNRVRISALIRC
jgi:hypothetical protein